ncbi:MAG: hypothetical protein J6W18_04005 [Bacteroidaceae bacterium]|nr:hypothetical protein [Bacteroidaceae bacterium]
MKKILIFLLIPVLFTACQKEDDENQDTRQEQEYEILSITEKGGLFVTYSYPSIDENGNYIRLSSALMASDPSKTDSSDIIRTVIIGCHITITSDAGCPTRLNTSASISDVIIMNTLPKSAKIPELKQSIVIMPDYQGFGISVQDVHPYLSQELTGRQVADAAKYGLLIYNELENRLPFADDWKTICLGFSQGGAVALAAQRYIEQNSLDEELHFAGSFCGDGPYDLIETLKYYMLDDGNSNGVQTAHTKGTISMPVVLPLIVKGMIDSHPQMKNHKASDYFSKQLLDTGIMDWLQDKQKSTMDIVTAWIDLTENGFTAKDGTSYSPEQMKSLFPDHGYTQTLTVKDYYITADLSKVLAPDLFDYLNDPSNYEKEYRSFNGDRIQDLMAALESNSTVKGWEPAHKIVMLHSKYDTAVPFSNLLSFTSSHPDADIRTVYYGTKDHQTTGKNFFLALLTTTFSNELTWLFAEK